MHVAVLADKTESLYGLQLVDLLSHLLSQPDIVVSVQEKFRYLIDIEAHPRINFVHDFSTLLCETYVLYGMGATDLIMGYQHEVCYIPDPDFRLTFQQLHEELEPLITSFKSSYPRGSFFSLFTDDLTSSFNYLKLVVLKDNMSPFDLCIVIDDSYEKVLKELNFCNLSVLLIYTGSDIKEIEEIVEGMWLANPDVSLSTFQEPVSFSHACLAKKVIFACKNMDYISKFLRDVRFNIPNIELLGSEHNTFFCSLTTNVTKLQEGLLNAK